MSCFYRIWPSLGGRTLAVVLGLFLVLLPLAGCAGPIAGPSVQNSLQMTPINLGLPARALKSPVVGQLSGDTTLHVRVTFKIDPNWLQQMEQRKPEPGKPSHLEEAAKKVGMDDATYQKIKNFFNIQGAVVRLSKLRTHLSVDAKARTVAKLLQTKFVVHRYNGHTFYAPDTTMPPKAPQFLVNMIDAITGLDNYSSQPEHSLSFRPTSSSSAQRSSTDCYPQDQTLLPKEIAHAYGFDQLWRRGWSGENMTINLVEIDGSYRGDIQNYLGCLSNYHGSVQTVNVDGNPRDTLGESTLDIQMIAGLARSANINVYQTDGTQAADNDIWINVNDMLQQIIDDNVNKANTGSTVSISLGTSEDDISIQDIRAIDSSIQQLTRAEHMTVFVASGDCGAFTSRVYGQLSVAFPASDPWVVSVGGTILQVDQDSNRANEVAWSDDSNRSKCTNQWGSGGGVSHVFRQMSWQNAPGVKNRYSRGTREVPDVSAVAYALAVYFNGQWRAVGGTSAAAPIWAAGLALVNEGLIKERGTFMSDTSPRLFYTVMNRSNGMRPFFDITNGNNLYYPATPGWDYATGLGTPTLPDFYQVVKQNLK